MSEIRLNRGCFAITASATPESLSSTLTAAGSSPTATSSGLATTGGGCGPHSASQVVALTPTHSVTSAGSLAAPLGSTAEYVNVTVMYGCPPSPPAGGV